MQQLFFVFPQQGEKALSTADCAALLQEYRDLMQLPASATDKLVFKRNDPDFTYALMLLEQPVNAEIEAKLKAFTLEHKRCDVLFSENFPCFGARDLRDGALVMDMDMTTVQIEGIDEIARCLGVYDDVAAVTSAAMHGHLEFSESLRRRVALLKGGDAASVLAHVKTIMTETSGLAQLMAYCHKLKPHFKTCIASGGFHELISVIDHKYGLDLIAANRLKVDAEGKFTGEVDGPIVDGQAKANLVRTLKEQYGVAQERIIVIGDGANDLLMMSEGGLGIAYHAKPAVQEKARNVINVGDLRAVAALLELRAES